MNRREVITATAATVVASFARPGALRAQSFRGLQDDIYRLALRMLWNREDAEDATQEILVRIVTRLSQFGFRSRLKTWAYRLSVNYILDLKKSPIERLNLTFQQFGENLTRGIEPVSATETERSVLIDEVKVGCSLATLQCLLLIQMERPYDFAVAEK